MTDRYNPQHGANMVDRYIGSAFDIVYAVYKQLGNMPVFLEFVNETSPRMEDQYADIIGRFDHIVDLEASALDSKEVAVQAAEDAMEYRDTTQQLINEAEEFKQFVENVVENTIQDIEDRFAEFIVASGYEFIGNYGIGIEVTEYNQLLRDVDGEFWRLSGQRSIPYITTGAGLPEDDAFIPVGDASLRQDLDDPTHGSKLIRYDDNNSVHDAISRNREDFWANKETMGGIYTHYVREDDGTPVAGAECAVYVGKTGVLATGLKDKFGEPLANPFVSGTGGLVQFVADPGMYTLQVSFDLVTHTYSVYFADEQVRADLANATDPDKGAGMVGWSREPLEDVPPASVHTALSAGVRSIWELSGLVTDKPDPKNPDTWDWHPALQEAFDIGGPWYLPDNNGNSAIYLISDVLQIRYNRALSFFGPPTNRPRVSIRTTTNFTARSIVRQWDSSWYAEGENNQDARPENLEPFWDRVDRYPNIRNIMFYIDSDAGGEITCLDLVSLQESSKISGCIFNGRAGIEKGWPIRIRSGGGFEVSMNGTVLEDIVVYGTGWRGELMVTGAGSDVNAINWITSPAVHKESPFQLNIIDMTFQNLHCEAYAVGLPTFDVTGPDVRLSDSFIIIRDLQGDVFKCTNPYGTGYGRTGVSATNLKLYAGAEISNSADILLYNDLSQSTPIVIPLLTNGLFPSLCVTLSRAGATLLSGNNSFIIDKTSGSVKSKRLQYVPPGGNISYSILAGDSITISDDALKSDSIFIDWSAGSVSGAEGNDYFNNPQSGRITLLSSYNGSQTRRKAMLYTDHGPDVFGDPVWDAVEGSLTIPVMISITNAKFLMRYV